MEKRQLLFKPNIDEDDWLEKNNISWAAFCHDALYKAINGKKQELIDRIGYRLLIILIGILCITYTFVIVNLFVLVVSSFCGAIAIIIGTFSILKEYRNV